MFDEAQALLSRIIKEGLLKASGVVALLPASSVGDDIQVFNADRSSPLGTLYGLRQQVKSRERMSIPLFMFSLNVVVCYGDFFTTCCLPMIFSRQRRMLVGSLTCAFRTSSLQNLLALKTTLACLLFLQGLESMNCA